MKRFWTRILPAYAYVLAVFVACTIPVPPPIEELGWSDKSEHLLAFALLQVLLVRLAAAGREAERTIQLRALFGCALYGAVIELWQGLVPWRSLELFDWVADVLGAVLGCLLYLAWRRLRGDPLAPLSGPTL